MILHRCDNCGTEATSNDDWLLMHLDTGDEHDLFGFRRDRVELCTWSCVRDFAVLKLTEAEVSA